MNFVLAVISCHLQCKIKYIINVSSCNVLWTILYLLENCHNYHKRRGSFYWVVYWLTLSEYVFNSAAIWKNKMKKKINLTNIVFFFPASAGIVHFQLPNLVYLRVVYICTFFTVYKNYLHNGLMGHSKNLGNIKVKVTLTTRKPPSPNIWQTIFFIFYVQFSIIFYFLFKREGGSYHSLGTCLLRLW